MADVAAEQASSGHQSEKRKRGRPRKLKTDQSEEPKPKRARGRPKGSKNKKPSKFQEILRPVKYKALLKVQKNKTVSKKSLHKWSKRMIHDLQANPTQLQNVQTDSSNNPNRVNNKFANSKNNGLKKMKNSVMPQNSSKCKTNQGSVISNHSKKRPEVTVPRKIKTSMNSKCQVDKKCDPTKMNSKSIHFPNNNQGQRILSSRKNSAITKQLQTPVNYRRKSCGLCDQSSVRRHKATSKRFCSDPSSYKCSRSLPTLRRSQRIRTICDKFSNSTISSENSPPSSAVYYSSPGFLVPLRRRRSSKTAHSTQTQLRNVSQPCSSHHSPAAVNSTTSLSSHTTGTTTTTITTTTTTTGLSSPAAAPPSSTASSPPSSVLSASTNNLHHLSSLPQSAPKDFPFECQAGGFTPANQSKDMTDAVHIVRPCGQLSPNNCSMKMLKCHRLRHMAPGSGDVAATSVVCRHHCSAARHLDNKCHNMHMNTQPCLPNIRSAVQVAASMISSRITDKSVSIYNHSLGKQSGSVCQSYEQLNIVLSPFEKQVFELHRQEHEQRMAMEEERHQMKMDLMRLKKKALESKLKLKN